MVRTLGTTGTVEAEDPPPPIIGTAEVEIIKMETGAIVTGTHTVVVGVVSAKITAIESDADRLTKIWPASESRRPDGQITRRAAIVLRRVAGVRIVHRSSINHSSFPETESITVRRIRRRQFAWDIFVGHSLSSKLSTEKK